MRYPPCVAPAVVERSASTALWLPRHTRPLLLVLRADQLEGCTEKFPEEARELAMIAEALEAYENRRWPDGKILLR